MSTTCIRRAAWVVAYDAETGSHRYLRDADVAFTGNTIEHVGPGFTGPVAEEIDGSGRCVMPGLVNIHGHPTGQPVTRGVREEMGNPRLYSSALYDRTRLWQIGDDDLVAGIAVALGELLKSGVTSVLDYPMAVPDGWLDALAASGMRVFAAPGFADAQWVVHGESKLGYEWDERRGRQRMEAAFALIDEANGHSSGRMTGVVAPSQVDTCTEMTLTESHRFALDRGLMWQVHAAQSLSEFHEMTQRHGLTPIEWLDRIGVLGSQSTVAHAIFTDAHPWTHWTAGEGDLKVLARTGTTVAHCPVVFSRYGHIMHSLGQYIAAGVNVGFGCDTAPHNMLEEMRLGLTLSRAAAGHMADCDAARVFNAATLGGAKAYLRDDIGRLAPGAKADLVLLDLENPYMRPVRDPIRNLIYTAADRAVRDVYVDGVQVVSDGEVLTLDVAAATAAIEAAQARAEAGVAEVDPLGRSGAEMSPPVFPIG